MHMLFTHESGYSSDRSSLDSTLIRLFILCKKNCFNYNN